MAGFLFVRRKDGTGDVKCALYGCTTGGYMHEIGKNDLIEQIQFRATTP